MKPWLRGYSAVVVMAATACAGSGAARADNYAYMGTGGANFGVIDLTTGVYTACGSTGVVQAGLAVGPDHALYGAAFRGTTFYRVAPKNGKLTPVGASNVTFFELGSTLAGVYAVDVNADLYAIDSVTGAGTLIGPTGIAVTGGGFWGMSTNSKTLYFSHQSSLYRLNLATGHGTLIGTAASGIYGAEVTENGMLFAGSESPLSVFTVSTTTGASTLVANVTGSGSGQFWGLAPIRATKISTAKLCSFHRI